MLQIEEGPRNIPYNFQRHSFIWLDKSYNIDIASSWDTYIDKKIKHNGTEGMYPIVIESKKQGYKFHSQDTVI